MDPAEVEIEYVGEQTVRTKAERTILQTSLSNGIPHFHECGGEGLCSTCRVEIIEGADHCSPRASNEEAIASSKQFGRRIRLACQTRARGNVTLRRLLRDRTDLRSVARDEGKAPGRELQLAVVFLDIRGFTAFTERHLPYDVVHVLNRFFNVVGEEIYRHHGYIDKYLGDGLMALFGLEDERKENPCVDAVRAACDAHSAITSENAYFHQHFGAVLEAGIGIHYGPTIVGDVGCVRKQQLTALGDVVNGAARIETATKEVGAPILVSDAVRRAVEEAAPGTCTFGSSHDLELRGKRGVHRIHEVVVASSEPA